ncbi:MAG: hypothetical protein A2836_02610 [Candidatus Taylorbacteria bacterium RIFCSPHIGHO2_01_FULL_45_63]|uniref:Uncharacterized protein n=1 Tax=Candidatus Taylorbacteria bacterium RIFCSPHIGHO2_02_FULL_45_35 TaxID=1802311 RepID=A0A1G2MQT0_9BACT|nr:MAG: hypothetical protein A2836_02610 [Candidatus Taylorbacteria bacterium RIFCSPHIGHO2_01_FULL_45_63]OHA26218.1 MAG: hypothetical protein A3D56_03565 [Candidatus Taylorbacteria bacterium RIFCSPHIGHO2_02_FULL_45_35]OHA32558.1 MAG: hypothetical protein A3A22_04055 [Candidatus Taylorbacteria bacterium RIFCSPLOWO2_01_FULL_45_34b]
MLTPSLRSQFVTKILASKTGEKFRVVFIVTLVQGEVQARMISAEPLEVDSSRKKEIKALGGEVKSVVKESEVTPTLKTPSPFFNNFLFFTSQPTRAPSNSF